MNIGLLTRCLLIFPLVLSVSLTAVGEDSTIVYKRTDAEGNVIFSDHGGMDSEEVEVREPITFTSDVIMEPDARIDYRRMQSEPDEVREKSYSLLAILEPANDATIRNNAGNFLVKGTFAPRLHQDHRLQLVIDNKIYASSEGAVFSLENIDRGTHELHLQIIDTLSQRVLRRSEIVTLNLMRHSIRH